MAGAQHQSAAYEHRLGRRDNNFHLHYAGSMPLSRPRAAAHFAAQSGFTKTDYKVKLRLQAKF